MDNIDILDYNFTIKSASSLMNKKSSDSKKTIVSTQGLASSLPLGWGGGGGG